MNPRIAAVTERIRARSAPQRQAYLARLQKLVDRPPGALGGLGGIEALADHRSKPDRVWNRIPDDVRGQIVDLALELPELSPVDVIGCGPLVKLDRIYGMFGQQADTSQWQRKFAESALAPFRIGAAPPPRPRSPSALPPPATWGPSPPC